MKTALRCLCLLLSVVLLTACGISGEYTLSQARLDGVDYDTAAMTQKGLDPQNSYILLNDDGTGLICIFGESALLEWEGSRLWPAGRPAEAASFTSQNGALTLEYNGDLLIFLK